MSEREWEPGDGYPLPPVEPVISRGQLWRHIYGLNHVTVRDFAEYTSGWMVVVTAGVRHDQDKDRRLISEAAFRKNWRLIDA